MASSYLFLLPIIVFLWFNLSFLLTFTIAAILGHIYPVFPYISDTGTFVPESSIFGQLVNMGSVLWVVYVRWRQNGQLCLEHELGKKTRLLNMMAACMGWLSCLTISMVANFPETVVFPVHVVSAALGFGSGIIWILLQTVLSYWLHPLIAGVTCWLLALRVTLAVLGTIAFVGCGVMGVLAFLQFEDGSTRSKARWRPEDNGWDMHVGSSFFEWFIMFISMTYILTLSSEFRYVYLSAPVVQVHAPILLLEGT